MIKILPVLISLLLVIGCSRYNMKELRISLETGDYEKTYTNLKKKAEKKPELPLLFEFGMVAHYANHFNDSNKAFAQAEEIAEDLYTKSVSKEALSLLTSDLAKPYPGKRYERLLAYYYQILNYVSLNQLSEALVECRQATSLIESYKDENEDYDFFASGFLAYLSAMLFEASGDWNDAFISYRQAEVNYRSAAEKTGVPLPVDIGHSLVRLARKLGFPQEATYYQKQYGEPPARPENYGELILFYETGYVPQKGKTTLTFPILKTDKFGKNNETEATEFVPTLRKRQGKTYSDVELEYLLHIEMPTYHSQRPQLSGIEVKVGQAQAKGILVEDVEKIAIETLNAEHTVILFRTLGRALLKYLAYRKAKNENKALGLLTNLVNIITEKADTRSWGTLPNRMFTVRIPLPEGTHPVNLSFLNRNGSVVRRERLDNVDISSNRITFRNHRTYK